MSSPTKDDDAPRTSRRLQGEEPEFEGYTPARRKSDANVEVPASGDTDDDLATPVEPRQSAQQRVKTLEDTEARRQAKDIPLVEGVTPERIPIPHMTPSSTAGALAPRYRPLSLEE